MGIHQFFIEYIAGVCGGVAVVCVGHPFDTIKTRLQTAPPDFYKSTLDCMKQTWRKEGFRGFYAGFMSPLCGQMFFRAASFATFRMVIATTNPHGKNQPTSFELMRAGAGTGFMISFIETPIDLVKTKLQICVFGGNKDKPKYSSVAECVRYLTKKNGIKSLWQGLVATMVRNIPANAVFFPVSEIVKTKIAQHNDIPIEQLQVHHKLIAGACAGMCYWIGTYPLDAIKGTSQSYKYAERLGWIGTVNKMWRDGGVGSFTRGFWPCAARSIPACAVMFTTVDLVREHLSVYNNNDKKS